MMMDPELQELVRRFFEIKVIQVNVQEMFDIGEGKCPLFFDLHRAFSEPLLRKKLIQKWTENLLQKKLFHNINGVVIAGTAVAGVVPAFCLAEAFKLPFVYIGQPQGQNDRHIRGLWTPGSQVIIVDDFVSTGSTLLYAVETLRKEGAQVLFATSIARHNLKSTRENLEKANVDLHSMFRILDIFDVAYNLSLITSKEMRGLMEWMSNEDVELLT